MSELPSSGIVFSGFGLSLILLAIFVFSTVSTAGLERHKWVERGLAVAVGVWVLTWWFGGMGVEVLSNATELVALIVSVLVSYLVSLWLAAKAKPHYETFFKDEQDEDNRKYLGLIQQAVKLSVFFIPFLFLTNLIMQVVLPVFKTGKEAPNSVIEHLGTFGDFFGGTLNPVLTFATFIALIATILIQLKELRLTREELKNSNKMLEMSQEEQSKTAKALEEQSRTQRIQQFDSNFFSLYDRLMESQDSLKPKADNLFNSSFVNEYRGDEHFFKKLFYQNYDFDRFFISLFQIFKLIKQFHLHVPKKNSEMSEYDNEQEILRCQRENENFRKNYSNILRSSLTNSFIFLLLANCSSINIYSRRNNGYETYRNILNDFNFFEHLDVVTVLNKRINFFDTDKSIEFKNVFDETCIIYSEYISLYGEHDGYYRQVDPDYEKKMKMKGAIVNNIEGLERFLKLKSIFHLIDRLFVDYGNVAFDKSDFLPSYLELTEYFNSPERSVSEQEFEDLQSRLKSSNILPEA